MSSTLLVIIVAVVAVGFFALGLSLTIIFKGHNIDSEIGDNKHMRERGIKCAAQQIREQERELMGGKSCDSEGIGCSPSGCSTCSQSPAHNQSSAQVNQK